MQIEELMKKHEKLFMSEGSWLSILLPMIMSTRKTINTEKIDLLLTKIENGELNEDFINKILESDK